MKNRISRVNFLYILFLLASLSLCLLFSGCGDKVEDNNNPNDNQNTPVKSTITIDGVEVELKTIHTENQNKYLAGAANLVSVYATGNKELSLSEGIKLEYTGETEKIAPYYFLVSENKDFSDYIAIEAQNLSCNVFNLKIQTQYFWKVCVKTSENNYEAFSEVYTFFVGDEAIRNLNIEGVTNARDLGGWKIAGTDKRTKQGLIYRTAKYNNDESTEKVITANGIDVMVNQLGIKTEVDLRTVSDNENGGLDASPLGESVTYISYPLKSGGNILSLNTSEMAGLFEIFGNEENYPIAFHCSIGTDRTGFVSFMLNSLLGVSDDDLERDFLFSNFANIGKRRTASVLDDYKNVIKSSEGNTTGEKMYNYLISIGVEKNNIDKFIEINK